jgi:cholest-4-en-3-one 26-monooxygenase
MPVSPVSLPEGFDFTDPSLLERRLPVEEFVELRRTAPVWWNAQPHGIAGFQDDGYWVVSRHADVKQISRDPQTFSSAENTAIIRFHEGMTREQIEAQRLILLNMDPPDHTKVRRIVSRGFTPKAVEALREPLRARSRRIVEEALAAGSGDFVEQVSCELPLQAIAELLGVPQEDRRKIFNWSNEMVAYDDPEYDIDPETAAAELVGYFSAMAEDRRANPRDDIVTKLVHADIDGEALTDDEFGFFVILLAVAGNETTRNAITHGMLAFFDHPEQWDLFKRERPETAADEIVRWATPIVSFQRTAMRDTTLSGVDIKKGERVGMFYSSANFDPDVFDEPQRFDVMRDPNPHLGFGGQGAHYCLGANLARLEIGLIFNAVADVLPDISKVGDPRRLRSGWINGVKEVQVKYT